MTKIIMRIQIDTPAQGDAIDAFFDAVDDWLSRHQRIDGFVWPPPVAPWWVSLKPGDKIKSARDSLRVWHAPTMEREWASSPVARGYSMTVANDTKGPVFHPGDAMHAWVKVLHSIPGTYPTGLWVLAADENGETLAKAG